MTRTAISTAAAPQAIGSYSQAIRAGHTVYLSGQIPLEPQTGELVQGDVRAQIAQVFANLSAVANAAGGTLAAAVKLTVYLVDLADFALVNEAMAKVFSAPYPARATVQVAALPKGASVEIDAVLVLCEPT